MVFSRRGLLGQGLVMGGLLGAGASGPAAAASVRGSGLFDQGPMEVEDIEFKSLADELNALLRLTCNLDGTDSVIWGHYTAYMIAPGMSPTPVVDYEGLEITRAARRSDGSYFLTGVDVSYPRDHRTGKFTSTVRNPVTGETLEVPTNVLDGSRDPGVVISPQVGWWPLREARPTSIDLHSRWWRERDIGRLLREQSPPPGSTQNIIISYYYEFPMSAFENPKVTAIPCRSGGIYVFPYPKWMKMGDRPGHMLGMTSGQKLRSVKDLPREFRERTEREHPTLLSLDTLFQKVPAP